MEIEDPRQEKEKFLQNHSEKKKNKDEECLEAIMDSIPPHSQEEPLLEYDDPL